MEIVERSSPNFGPRRDGLRPELVVLHHTAMPTAEAALDAALRPGGGGLGALSDRRGRPGLAAGRRGGARLARRRRQLGRARRTSTRARSGSSSPTPGRSPASRRSPSRRWRRSRRCSTAILRALGDPAGRGDRPFRHGAGPQGRPGAEVRLAAAGARRARGLGRRRRRGRRGGLGRRSAAAAAAAGYAAPDGDWAAVLAAVRLRFRPWARGERRGGGRGGARALAAAPLALTGARFPPKGARADGRMAAARKGRGKSGLQGEMAAGNARPG